MQFFNSASPFTIPTNTRKFAASATCILNVAHFVDYSPKSACHFRNCLENSCVISAGPNIYTTSVSTEHPVITLLAPCCCPAVGAAAVPVPPPIPFPPLTVFCSIGFLLVRNLFSACYFVLALSVLPCVGNVVACFVNIPGNPPGIPSVLGDDVGAFSFPQP